MIVVNVQLISLWRSSADCTHAVLACQLLVVPSWLDFVPERPDVIHACRIITPLSMEVPCVWTETQELLGVSLRLTTITFHVADSLGVSASDVFCSDPSSLT